MVDALLVMSVFLVLFLMYWKAYSFCHPIMEWHHFVLGHSQGIHPAGFADWKIVCSCRREEWL